MGYILTLPIPSGYLVDLSLYWNFVLGFDFVPQDLSLLHSCREIVSRESQSTASTESFHTEPRLELKCSFSLSLLHSIGTG